MIRKSDPVGINKPSSAPSTCYEGCIAVRGKSDVGPLLGVARCSGTDELVPLLYELRICPAGETRQPPKGEEKRM